MLFTPPPRLIALGIVFALAIATAAILGLFANPQAIHAQAAPSDVPYNIGSKVAVSSSSGGNSLRQVTFDNGTDSITWTNRDVITRSLRVVRDRNGSWVIARDGDGNPIYDTTTTRRWRADLDNTSVDDLDVNCDGAECEFTVPEEAPAGAGTFTVGYGGSWPQGCDPRDYFDPAPPGSHPDANCVDPAETVVSSVVISPTNLQQRHQKQDKRVRLYVYGKYEDRGSYDLRYASRIQLGDYWWERDNDDNMLWVSATAGNKYVAYTIKVPAEAPVGDSTLSVTAGGVTHDYRFKVRMNPALPTAPANILYAGIPCKKAGGCNNDTFGSGVRIHVQIKLNRVVALTEAALDLEVGDKTYTLRPYVTEGNSIYSYYHGIQQEDMDNDGVSVNDSITVKYTDDGEEVTKTLSVRISDRRKVDGGGAPENGGGNNPPQSGVPTVPPSNGPKTGVPAPPGVNPPSNAPGKGPGDPGDTPGDDPVDDPNDDPLNKRSDNSNQPPVFMPIVVPDPVPPPSEDPGNAPPDYDPNPPIEIPTDPPPPIEDPIYDPPPGDPPPADPPIEAPEPPKKPDDAAPPPLPGPNPSI